MIWIGLLIGWLVGLATMLMALALCRAASIGDEMIARGNNVKYLEHEIADLKQRLGEFEVM